MSDITSVYAATCGKTSPEVGYAAVTQYTNPVAKILTTYFSAFPLWRFVPPLYPSNVDWRHILQAPLRHARASQPERLRLELRSCCHLGRFSRASPAFPLGTTGCFAGQLPQFW